MPSKAGRGSLWNVEGDGMVRRLGLKLMTGIVAALVTVFRHEETKRNSGREALEAIDSMRCPPLSRHANRHADPAGDLAGAPDGGSYPRVGAKRTPPHRSAAQEGLEEK